MTATTRAIEAYLTTPLPKRAPGTTGAIAASVADVKVAHVILRVRDMSESVGFYRDLVGLELASESPEFAFFDGGSISVALNAKPDEPRDETTTEIVLEVDDVAATYEDMAGRGIDFEVGLRPVMEQEGRTLQAAHFRDPDGHFWSITGWV